MKNNHYTFPTEAELSVKKSVEYRKHASWTNEQDKKLSLIDTQNGTLCDFISTLKLNAKVIRQVSKVIEKWMDSPVGDNRIDLYIDTTDGGKFGVGFVKYIVNFQDCANCCEQWMIVKCAIPGWPKMYTRHLGRFGLNSINKLNFVHNQLFPVVPPYLEGYKKETTFVESLVLPVENETKTEKVVDTREVL